MRIWSNIILFLDLIDLNILIAGGQLDYLFKKHIASVTTFDMTITRQCLNYKNCLQITRQCTIRILLEDPLRLERTYIRRGSCNIFTVFDQMEPNDFNINAAAPLQGAVSPSFCCFENIRFPFADCKVTPWFRPRTPVRFWGVRTS